MMSLFKNARDTRTVTPDLDPLIVTPRRVHPRYLILTTISLFFFAVRHKELASTDR